MQAETLNQIIESLHTRLAISQAGTGGAAVEDRPRSDTSTADCMLGLGVAIATGAAGGIAGDELIMRSRSPSGVPKRLLQTGRLAIPQRNGSVRPQARDVRAICAAGVHPDTYKDPSFEAIPLQPTGWRACESSSRTALTTTSRTRRSFSSARHDAGQAGRLLERPQVVQSLSEVRHIAPARYARAIATFMQGGQSALPAALEQVDALIRERPDNPYFHELKADFLTRSGKSREAIAPLRQALRLSKGASLIRVQLASALLATNDPKVVGEAADLLRKSIIEDENPRAYRSLADAYYRLGRQAEADAAIAQAYFLEGDVKQAQNFATRAQRALRQGSPTWLKMDDIINYKSSSDL